MSGFRLLLLRRRWLRLGIAVVVAPLAPLALIVLAVFVDLARGPLEVDQDVPVQAYPQFFGILHLAYGIAVVAGAVLVAIPAVRSLLTGRVLVAMVLIASACLSFAFRRTQGLGIAHSISIEYALLFSSLVLLLGLWAWVIFLFLRPSNVRR